MTSKITSFRGEYAFLSNMFEHFTLHTISTDPMTCKYPFRCAEAAFQAHKTFDPVNTLAFIIMIGKEAKSYGKKVILRPDWNKIRIEIMQTVLYEKFANPELQKRLLATGDAELIEGNTWGDTFWGVYNNQEDAPCENCIRNPETEPDDPMISDCYYHENISAPELPVGWFSPDIEIVDHDHDHEHPRYQGVAK